MVFQLGAPLLDACVLAVLDKEDTYGYVLTQNVKEVVDISESTLYSVLRRLQKEECLVTYDQPFGGRNRRYYQITSKGNDMLQTYRHEWQDYKIKIDKIMMEGKIDEQGTISWEIKK